MGDAMIGEYRKDLEPSVLKAEAEILRLVRKIVPGATLQRIGPIDINGPSWDCWIVTPTDAERNALAAYIPASREHPQQQCVLRADLQEELLNAAMKAGFAPESFCVQSQETVERDFKGSWFYAMR